MLYEPTQITPSILTSTGTIAAADSVQIEWQVNGNSAMIAFQIDVYKNDYNSTLVYSTGIISETSSPSSALPFYGKNKNGNNVTFSYAPLNTAWCDLGLEDGNEYKFKITQFYSAINNCLYMVLTEDLIKDNTYYYKADFNGTTYYIYFSVSDPYVFISGATVYYSITNGTGFVVFGNIYRVITVGISTTSPSDTYLGDGASVNYSKRATTQNSFSVILTREQPTLSINSFSVPVDTAKINLVATYEQAQSDNIKWVRWQFASVDADGTVDEDNLLDDTGEIYTPVLEYEYIGLINGNYYAVNCMVETENGIQIETGWNNFEVLYNQNTYLGDLSVSCKRDEDCNLLSWSFTSVIPATVDGSYEIIDGFLVLGEDSSLTWNTRDDEALNIATPWTAVLRFSYPYENFNSLTIEEEEVSNGNDFVVFSPDGDTLILGGNINGLAAFSVNGTEVTYLEKITVNGGSFQGYYTAAALSPDGSLLVLSGFYPTGNYTKVFSIEGTDLTEISTLDTAYYNSIAFSPDGTLLILGGYMYSVSGSDITYIDILAVDGVYFESTEYITFSPDGSMLVIDGRIVASINGTTLTSLCSIKVDGEIVDVSCATFSPDGSLLVLGNSLVFSVEDTEFTYLGTIINDISEDNFTCVSFSPDGALLFMGSYYEASEKILDEQQLLNIQSNDLLLLKQLSTISISVGTEYLTTQQLMTDKNTTLPDGARLDSVSVVITPEHITFIYELSTGSFTTRSYKISYTQQEITEATLTGNLKYEYFLIVDGDSSDIISKLASDDFIPNWSSHSYTVELLAMFENGTDGGSSSADGNGFIIKRIENNDETTAKTIAQLDSTITELKDFGIKSCTTYTYQLYIFDSENAFMGVIEATVKPRQFQRNTLIATEYNNDDGLYHVVKEYQFSANLTENPSISNNNSPSFLDNFTPYPTKFSTTSNYASGTLSGLIGYVDLTTNKYLNDTVALQKELCALSTSGYDFFLKDMKGHLWQVVLSAPVQHSWTIKTREQQTTVSIPWKEIADTDTSIVCLPNDDGWYKDDDILGVLLNIDIDTGLLNVTYPNGYSKQGTTFSLASNTLYANTPDGTSAAELIFDSESGEVIATTNKNQ